MTRSTYEIFKDYVNRKMSDKGLFFCRSCMKERKIEESKMIVTGNGSKARRCHICIANKKIRQPKSRLK
jgi:hypothetical protein